jgi:hypothetical protein
MRDGDEVLVQEAGRQGGAEMLIPQNFEVSEAELCFLSDLIDKSFEASSALVFYLGQVCRQGCLVCEIHR